MRRIVSFLSFLGFVCAAYPSFATTGRPLSCLGTEPFWSAILDETKATFEGVTNKYTYQVKKVEPPIGMHSDYMKVYHDARGPLAVVKKGDCIDYMSDKTHEFEVTIFTTEGAFRGCCNTGLAK